jgi:predicted porin
MKSGLKLSTAAVALLTVVGMGMAPASAADLGGDCCADLEERIAELEATTARKGNRKVSLEISGHVNEALIFWDDGVEQNVGQYTNDNSRSRFRFRGSAAIADGVKAGYLIEIGVRGANSKRFNQDVPSGAIAVTDTGLDVRHSAWYVESKSYGTVWVGRTGPAAEGITEINLSNAKDIAKLADIEDSALGLLVRNPNGALTNVQFRRAIRDTGDQPGEPERGNIVKYISPAFEGFSLSAAWGGDDYWDIGGNYKGEFAGFKVVGGIAYGEDKTEGADADGQIGNCNTSSSTAATGGASCKQFGGSLSVMHEDTGLYATGSAGWSEDERAVRLFNGNGDTESTFWALEAGIQQKFFPLGTTTIFAQYYDGDSGSSGRAIGDAATSGGNGAIAGALVSGSDIQMYGGGIVQALGGSDVLLYAYYRHVEVDFDLRTAGNAAVVGFENGLSDDLDMVVTGAMIKF